MIVHYVQTRKHKTYHIYNHTVNYDPNSFDIGLGYIDSTSAFATWTPDSTNVQYVLDTIKSLNPSLEKIYTVIWYWDTDYISVLTQIGFQFEEISAVGDPSELCMVYLYQ